MTAPRCDLRFFLDPGSGVCLWSQNDAARDRFDYPVELDDLQLPPDLKADLERLMADHDATIDWSDPGGTGQGKTPQGKTSQDKTGQGKIGQGGLDRIAFGHEAGAPFRDRILQLVSRLRTALGPGFAIATDYER